MNDMQGLGTSNVFNLRLTANITDDKNLYKFKPESAYKADIDLGIEEVHFKLGEKHHYEMALEDEHCHKHEGFYDHVEKEKPVESS